MLINVTLDKLQALSLGGMARAFTEQLESPSYQGLSFEERLGLLVDREPEGPREPPPGTTPEGRQAVQ